MPLRREREQPVTVVTERRPAAVASEPTLPPGRIFLPLVVRRP
jgi:hypothetical protein